MLENFIAAVHRFDSADKLREGILACIKDGEDVFQLTSTIDHRSAQNFYYGLRRGLHELNSADNIPPEEKDIIRHDLIEKLDQFEKAALSLIFDKGIFFIKTKYGNQNTISKLVGTMLISMMKDDNYPSPNRQSGKLADLITPHIEYDAVLSGEVQFKDRQRFVYNRNLLELLLSVRTKSIPPLEYWRNLQRNNDFVPFCYDAFKAIKLPEARQLIPRILATYLSVTSVAQLRRDFFFISMLHQEFGNPLSDFLENPINQFQTAFSSDLNNTSIRKTPNTVRLIRGGQIVILSSYTVMDGETEVTVVYVDDKVNEYKFRIDADNPTIPAEFHDAARRTALRMIKDYRRFTEQYKVDLGKALAGK